MNSLALLCYQSDAVLARATDLEAIATSSHHHNSAKDVTGCLFHEGGRYFQILEGPMRHLFALMLRLEKDSRHRCLVITAIAPLQRRQFAGFPLAVLSPSETLKLVKGCEATTRQQRGYVEPAARDQVMALAAEILRNRRQSVAAMSRTFTKF
jgi:hypothetical protein